MIENRLSEESTALKLLRLSIPLLLSGFLQSLYGIADMVVVGHNMKSVGLSAVSMGSQVMQVVTAFAIGLSTGGSVLVSQNIKREDDEGMKTLLGTLFAISAMVAVAISVLLGVFRNQVLVLFDTPENALNEAGRYLAICSAGILLIFAYNIINAVLRGMGNTKFTFYMTLVSVVLNLVLDIVFVLSFGMGAAGAALATVISQGVAAFGVLAYMLSKNSPWMPRKISYFKPDGNCTKMLLRVGVPAGAQPMVVFLSMLIVAGMVNSYGITVSAAYGACMKVDSLSILPRQAVAQAAAVLVGQNFSLGNHRRIKETICWAAAISFGICCVIGLVVRLSAPWLVGFFDNDPAVVEEGVKYLRIMCWGYPITGLLGAFNSLTIGIGFTAFALVNSFLDSIIARVLLCDLLGSAIGLEGIYLGLVLAPIFAVAFGGGYFFFGRWKHRKVLSSK